MGGQRSAFETKPKVLVNKMLDGSQPILVRIKVLVLVFVFSVANKSCLVEKFTEDTLDITGFEKIWRRKEEETESKRRNRLWYGRVSPYRAPVPSCLGVHSGKILTQLFSELPTGSGTVRA